MALSGFERYRQNLRTNATALWNGTWTAQEFDSAMLDSVDKGFANAWEEGAREMGILPGEFTDEEMKALYGFLAQALDSLPGLTRDIQDHSRANKGKLSYSLNRIELWAQQYKAVQNEAKTRAGANQKLVWRLGATEKSCADCLRYNGRVYRASTWARYNIRPQSPQLACHGFRCDCRLEITTAPANRGRPPSMTGG